MARNKKESLPEKVPPSGSASTQDITKEMREAYLDYAMSVIVARALPDVRDGLKPVQRRILFAMKELGYRYTSKTVKSARIVGEVMGKYHPHGDSAIYDTLARMAQSFSLRYPLIHGQGNFGSIDGDAPAAMRYTEAKMAQIADELLSEIDKDTVDFAPNYDGSRREPVVLPARLPQLLLNGSFGIAVGMATSIPPHNLRELIDALVALIKNPKIDIDELMAHVKGPDFPTGGIIYNKEDIKTAYATGRGGVVMRGEAEIVEDKKKMSIHISSLPFQVNKAELVEKIAEMVRDKKIEGIRDLRDESDKRGLSVVVDLKSDAYGQKVLNALYKHTDLEKTFHFNMIALAGDLQPHTITLKSYLEEFLAARIVVVERRTKHELRVAEERAHILEGLKRALDHIDEVIKVIKKSKDREEAHKNLCSKFKLTEKQATAILEMRLQTLSGLERKKVEHELAELKTLIKELKSILGDPKKIREVITKEFLAVREKYGDERKTKVIESGTKAINMEDIIPEEEHVVLMTAAGYLKRVRPQEFRSQRRGGKGTVGGEWKEEDVVTHFLAVGTHDPILFFTSLGKVYETKAYEIPESSRTAKGKPVVNFLSLGPNEEVTSIRSVPKKTKDRKDEFLMMATKNGMVKKAELEDYIDVRRSGILAMRLKKGDMLSWVRLISKNEDCMLFSKKGQAIRFKGDSLRPMGRQAQGVRGMKLRSGDAVIGCEVISHEQKNPAVFVVSAHGFGKKTKAEEFKTQSRGGSGVKAMNISDKTGPLVAARIIYDETEEFIAISAKGKTLRSKTKEIPLLGRATQGVRIMKLEDKDTLSSTATL